MQAGQATGLLDLQVATPADMAGIKLRMPPGDESEPVVGSKLEVIAARPIPSFSNTWLHCTVPSSFEIGESKSRIAR